MREFELGHLSDAVILRDLADRLTQERITTATVLAYIAEADARRLYAPAGYSSMHAYCVEELGLSEDAAYKRIQAARAGRQFPALFKELSSGRLHLAAVCLLAPHLMPENAEELISAAANRRKSEVEAWLAQRFMSPRPSFAPSTVRRIAVTPSPKAAMDNLLTPGESSIGGEQLAPGQVDDNPSNPSSESPCRAVGAVSCGPRAGQSTSQVVERFEIRVTIDRTTFDRIRYAQALLSHAIPDGDLAQVLGRAVEALITVAERRKVGAPGGQARHAAISRGGRRYIPANVRRAVWERDQGRCTFVGTSGHRCEARRLLEFDHVEPIARGGESTVEGLRLRCRAHNQYEAERVLGSQFMKGKREEARRRGAWRSGGTAAAGARVNNDGGHPTIQDKEQEATIVSALKNLGCRSDEARRAAEYAWSVPALTFEERMRAALTYLRPRSARATSNGVMSTCPGASHGP